VVEVRQTEVFSRWLVKLRDDEAFARIHTRIRRLILGSFGDVKPVGKGIYEMRIDYGPGYRVYYTQVGSLVVLLLVGGTKKTQQSDIDRAIAMAKEEAHGT
jgi:putative addiction module killer protein